MRTRSVTSLRRSNNGCPGHHMCTRYRSQNSYVCFGSHGVGAASTRTAGTVVLGSTNTTQCRAASNTAQEWPSAVSTHMRKVLGNLHALYRFTRPHTVIGTVLSVLSVSTMAGGLQPWTGQQWNALLQALIAAFLANISIVGLNQCCDVEIDKVNKPYLPLASGEWSYSTGLTWAVVTGVLALAVSWNSGSVPLLLTVCLSLLLGIAYSADLPWLRWKRYANR
jgi:homogentisate phytyltransferase / homogentisate geranylgeranyltransferase